MIILNDTIDTIQILLNAAHTTNALECFASYRDITTTTYLAGKNTALTNGTTPVVLCGSPAASTQRVIDFISVFNSDTASKIVTIRFNDGTNIRRLFVTTLGVGEKLEYTDSKGFCVFTNSGAVKTSINQGTSPISDSVNVVVLNADVTNNNAVANTMQDVTGLSFPVTAGLTYWFRVTVDYTAAATTTGSRWSINGPTFSRLSYRSVYSLTTTSNTTNTGLTAYDLPAASNTSSAATGGNNAVIEGFIIPSADGTLVVRFASEVASSAIVAKAGSVIQWLQVI